MNLSTEQWVAIGVGVAALVVMFWNQIKTVLPVPAPDGADTDEAGTDLEDFRALQQLEDRAKRLKSKAFTDAMSAVKTSFFG